MEVKHLMDIQLRSFSKDLLIVLRSHPMATDETTQVDIIVMMPGCKEITTISVTLRRRKSVDTLRDDLKAYAAAHKPQSADDIRIIIEEIRAKEITLV